VSTLLAVWVLIYNLLCMYVDAGLLVAASLKYADAVIKCFASAMSILFTVVVSGRESAIEEQIRTDCVPCHVMVWCDGVMVWCDGVV
jgi:hypothetical protein